jgi:acetyl-CoA acetyltransferase
VAPVFVVDACRTPIGTVKGALAEVRPDHLAADTLKALTTRNGWLDDLCWGAANQAGEDKRRCGKRPK